MRLSPHPHLWGRGQCVDKLARFQTVSSSRRRGEEEHGEKSIAISVDDLIDGKSTLQAEVNKDFSGLCVSRKCWAVKVDSWQGGLHMAGDLDGGRFARRCWVCASQKKEEEENIGQGHSHSDAQIR
ncbi:uncharacterized protein LOC122014652 [Zingiber officinale]|uniref:Uncharacterized protein n=1 Tax=Zingiber officinale TaxID=94328 RepID=A0A8J5F814_ZINOF|nr:uncharacterized protein LOC122014652 [Zingiber officinale]KAG6483341.1 hypothetical protein ZIOFF_059985 [Zingiber officinale]